MALLALSVTACTLPAEPSEKVRDQERRQFVGSFNELRDAASMMSSDDRVDTAKYLVRCALPADDAITIKDYTGGVMTLRGELGLAPEWKATRCDNDCEEKINACLMAASNGTSKHVQLDLVAYHVLGPERSPGVITLPVAVAHLLNRQGE